MYVLRHVETILNFAIPYVPGAQLLQTGHAVCMPAYCGYSSKNVSAIKFDEINK